MNIVKIILNDGNTIQTGMSWFAALGVRPTASPREVKNKYHALALLYHPDKCRGKIDNVIILDRSNKKVMILSQDLSPDDVKEASKFVFQIFSAAYEIFQKAQPRREVSAESSGSEFLFEELFQADHHQVKAAAAPPHVPRKTIEAFVAENCPRLWCCLDERQQAQLGEVWSNVDYRKKLETVISLCVSVEDKEQLLQSSDLTRRLLLFKEYETIFNKAFLVQQLLCFDITALKKFCSRIAFYLERIMSDVEKTSFMSKVQTEEFAQLKEILIHPAMPVTPLAIAQMNEEEIRALLALWQRPAIRLLIDDRKLGFQGDANDGRSIAQRRKILPLRFSVTQLEQLLILSGARLFEHWLGMCQGMMLEYLELCARLPADVFQVWSNRLLSINVSGVLSALINEKILDLRSCCELSEKAFNVLNSCLSRGLINPVAELIKKRAITWSQFVRLDDSDRQEIANFSTNEIALCKDRIALEKLLVFKRHYSVPVKDCEQLDVFLRIHHDRNQRGGALLSQYFARRSPSRLYFTERNRAASAGLPPTVSPMALDAGSTGNLYDGEERSPVSLKGGD